MPEETYAAIVSRLKEKGYEIDRLRRTPQPVGEVARGG